MASPEVDLIVLPYQSVLSKETRESLNIELDNRIIIFDEAHNVIESANDIHTHEVSISDLKSFESALSNYYNKFKTRLNSSNEKVIRQCLKLI